MSRITTVILGLSLGVGAGAIGTWGLLTLTLGQLQSDGWGAAPVWLFMGMFGAALGAIAGVVLSVIWTQRPEFKAFDIFEWLGIFLGAVVGLLLLLWIPDRYYLFVKCLVAAACLPISMACGRIALMGLRAVLQAAASKAE